MSLTKVELTPDGDNVEVFGLFRPSVSLVKANRKTTIVDNPSTARSFRLG